MGKQLVEKLLLALRKIEWPEVAIITEPGRQAFFIGVERVDSYKSDPQILLQALRIFQTSGSQPFAYAGVAYTLLVAACEKDGTYAQAGLDASLQWLERAQELEADDVDINVIEALIYIYGGRLPDARVVLDYLQDQEPINHYLHRAEIAYWQRKKDLEQVLYWSERASESVGTIPQRLRLRRLMADCYLEFGRLDEALDLYKEALQYDRNDHWLWHKLSQVYLQKGSLDEAELCNQRALQLHNFPEARQMEAAIRRKKLGTGKLGRLLGLNE